MHKKGQNLISQKCQRSHKIRFVVFWLCWDVHTQREKERTCTPFLPLNNQTLAASFCDDKFYLLSLDKKVFYSISLSHSLFRFVDVLLLLLSICLDAIRCVWLPHHSICVHLAIYILFHRVSFFLVSLRTSYTTHTLALRRI